MYIYVFDLLMHRKKNFIFSLNSPVPGIEQAWAGDV